MASTLHFQLFPSAVPSITVNPPRYNHRVKTFTKTNPSPVESVVRSPNTESVIIKIVEQPDENLMADLADEPRSRSPSPEHEQETVPASPIDGHNGHNGHNGHRPSPITIPPPTHVSQPSSAKPYSPARETSPTSPIVPMRSMFPTYNPSVPLAHQQYFPQRVTDIQRQNISREDYSPSVSSPSRMDSALGGPRTAPASMVDFPADVLALREPQFSTVPQLEKLWAATNGQEPDIVAGDFDLRMSR